MHVFQKYKSKTCGEWEGGFFWVYMMDDYVQRTGKIVGIAYNGIQLDFEDGVRTKFWFPYSVLRKEKEVKKSYIERQDEWANKNNIEAGNTVRVIRRAKQGEEGWRAVWDEEMESIVGEAGVVKSFIGDAGVRVRFNEKFSWSLPYFVLEKVESEEKEMKKSYKERQAEWVKENNIRIGDHVRLIRAASAGEDGWPNAWPSTANGWVGNILKVDDIGERNIACYNPDADDWFGFPYFVLEKVGEHKDKEWEVSYGLKVKTGDPVLVRDSGEDTWRFSYFSDVLAGGHIVISYRTVGLTYTECIPYVGNEHLVGTKNDYKAPEEPTKPKFIFGAKVKATLSCGDEMEGVLIGFDEEDDDSPFEVAVRDEDADLGRIRYCAKSVTYID